MPNIKEWDPFIDVNRVANALRHEEKADIPPAIMACFSYLCACELSEHWLDVINESDSCGDYVALDFDFLLLTKNKLLEAGFRDENISLCIGSMIASTIANHVDFVDVVETSTENNADKIITKCSMYLLSGYMGQPDIEILNFVLSLDESDKCVDSSNLRRLLKLTLENDETSRRELILSVVPLWKNLIDSSRIEVGTWEEVLGFPLVQAMLLKEPSDLAVLGDFLYDTNAYELAYPLMARSALLGNEKAWDHLSLWLSANADNYEPNKILEALIKAGKQGLSHNSEMQSIQLNTGTITSHHTSEEYLMDLDSGESTLADKTSQNDVNGDQSGGFNFRHLENIRKGLSLSLDEFCGLFDVSRVTYSGWIRGANIRKKNYHKIVDIFEKLQAFINSEHINEEFYKMQESENKSEYLLKLFKRLYG